MVVTSFVILSRVQSPRLRHPSSAASMAAGGGGVVAPLLGELKKQASVFLRNKIRIARLALTDVTPIQLLTEEVTKGKPAPPDARTMAIISRAAFEIEDYWRIVDILHTRLGRSGSAQWREAYNSLILLEHLLTHGPASIAEEFQSDSTAIARLQSLKLIDERGFDWGMAAKNKSQRVLRLLQRGPLLREERDRARKLSRGIQGFGRRAELTEIRAKPESGNKRQHEKLDRNSIEFQEINADGGFNQFPGKENNFKKTTLQSEDESRPLLLLQCSSNHKSLN
ncbi:uncharacterized protein LOC144714457 [Wolffia australiana]